MSTLSSQFRNKTVTDVFVDLISLSNDGFNETITLFVSSILSILYLLSQITSSRFDHDDEYSGQLEVISSKFGIVLESTGLMAIESAMGQGSSADLTRRAIKYQNCITISETTLALALTRTRISAKRKEGYLQRRINNAELELKELQTQSKVKEEERTKLSNTLHEQTAKYEKRLELVRFETQSIAKKSADIHINERQRAEQHATKCERLYHDEKELRLSAQQQNQDIVQESTRLGHELSRCKSNIAELQKLLDQERKGKEEYAAALETSQRELKLTSKELDNCIGAKAAIEDKLSNCEKKVLDMTAANKDYSTSLEDACEKLINLSTIFQRKEAEMDKIKAELRSHVNAANKNADTAISKYEASRKEARVLRKDLEIALSELNELKSHRADVQRLRKNAPTSYINQLRNDPRVQAQPRKSRSGKENSLR
jgi:chromosome segregation ATPase